MIPFLRPSAAATALAAASLLLSPCASVRAADETPAPAVPAPAIPAPAIPAPVAPAPEAPATPTPVPVDPARHAAAEELVAAMHLEKGTDAAAVRMNHSVDQITERMGKQPNATPEQLADAQKLRDELHGMVDKGLGWEAIKPEVVRSYEEGFSEAEIKEISAFYHSPTGQKLADNQMPLNERFGKAIQQRTMMLVPAIRQKLQAASLKNRPAPIVPPVPAAPPAAAASPGATVTALPTPTGTAAPMQPIPVPVPTAAPTATVAATPVPQP